MSSYTPLAKCLACGGTRLDPYLDLGRQPLANSCHDGGQAPPEFPLAIKACLDCWHSQLSVAVDRDLLFKQYLYVSGTTRTLRDYFAAFADRVGAAAPERRPLRVLDIASNDGSLLAQFKARGHTVCGVDPAENLRPLSAQNGIPTIVDYWGESVLSQLREPFDVIVAMNVLGHVPEPLRFLEDCRQVLYPDGRIYIQTSQAKMIKNGEFDTIYHEHHSFFSVSSFLALAHRAGLRVVDIVNVPVHGDSYLVEVRTAAVGARQCPDTFELGRAEAEWGYYRRDTYRDFTRRAEATRRQVSELVERHRADGFRIVGYGVAAKGMTFSNWAGLRFDYLIDDNPLKVGLFTPGGNAPIHGPDRLDRENEKALFVVLAWNFFDEVMGRIRARRHNPTDVFLAYFPQVKLISASSGSP